MEQFNSTKCKHSSSISAPQHSGFKYIFDHLSLILSKEVQERWANASSGDRCEQFTFSHIVMVPKHQKSGLRSMETYILCPLLTEVSFFSFLGASRPPRSRTSLLCRRPGSSWVWDSPFSTPVSRNLPQLSAMKRSWKPRRLSWACPCWFLVGVQDEHVKFSRFYLWTECEGKAFGKLSFLVRLHGLVNLNMLNFALCLADKLP